MSQEIIINGWLLCAHPLFLSQFESRMAEVEALRRRDTKGYKNKKSTKILAAIHKIIFQEIPADPAHPKYRQGETLGEEHKNWFRAKFFQQYRLFFRFHKESKIIVFAWVNDEDTKRAYDSKTDAYEIFRKMLNRGNPPSDWDSLLRESKSIPQTFQPGIDEVPAHFS